jgi:hypothetical protein
VKNLILTITPVDFHQDQAEGRPATASSTCGPGAWATTTSSV